jgi:hypothetical protein
MQQVSVEVECGSVEPPEAYRTIRDFGRYAEQTDAVRSVSVEEEAGDRSVSRWEVNFRDGVLVWTERDAFREHGDGRFTIEFEQLEGDPEHFSGSWLVAPADAGSHIRFEASLDLGIATLEDIIDPIAARTLYDNVVRILQGLLGEDIAVLSAPPGGQGGNGHAIPGD